MYVLCSSKWRCFYRFSNLFSPPTIWLRQSLPIAGLENWRIPLDISGCRPKLHLLAAHLSTGCAQPINNRLFCPLDSEKLRFQCLARADLRQKSIRSVPPFSFLRIQSQTPLRTNHKHQPQSQYRTTFPLRQNAQAPKKTTPSTCFFWRNPPRSDHVLQNCI